MAEEDVMSAQRNPVGPIRQLASKGPQLVRTEETVPSKAPVEAIERADPHPLAAAFIIGGIAATGAITFAGSVLMWVWFRDTGVNWMFQGH
jgi:hypothetical protein